MAAYHVIGQDAAIQLTLSTNVANGVAPTYGSPLVLLGDAMEVGVDEDLDTVEVAGIGNARKKIRAKRGGTKVSIKKFVLSTGCAARALLGYYGKFEFKELSTMSVYASYEGIITKWHWGTDDNEQVEEIEITCDAEHA